MTRVNIVKEMVNNHTTEEVIDWMESTLRRDVAAINSESQGNEAFFLGQCSMDLQELHAVALALRNKLGPRPPIVT